MKSIPITARYTIAMTISANLQQPVLGL